METTTRALWASRVREWRSSGKTAAEFAAARGLNAATLKWWSSEFNRPRPSTPPVVEVQLGTTSIASALEVLLPGGSSIRVPRDFDEATLRRLLAVLEDR